MLLVHIPYGAYEERRTTVQECFQKCGIFACHASSCPDVRIEGSYLQALGLDIGVLQVSFSLTSGSCSSLFLYHIYFQAHPSSLSANLRGPLTAYFTKSRQEEDSGAVVSLSGWISWEVIFLDIEMTLLLLNPKKQSDLVTFCIICTCDIFCYIWASYFLAGCRRNCLARSSLCQRARQAKLLPQEY